MLEMYRRDQFRQDLLVDRCVELVHARGAPRRARRAARRRGVARPHAAGGALRVRRADLLGLEVLRPVRAAGRPAAPRRRSRDLMAAAAASPRLLPELRRRLRAAPGVLPRMRRPACRRTAASSASSQPTWQRRLAWYPGDWIWPVLLFLVLTIVATAAAVAASASRDQTPATIVATATHVTVGPGATQATVARSTQASTLPTAPAPTITTGTLPRRPAPRRRTASTTRRRRRTRTPSPSGRPARAATRTCSSRCPLAAGRANAVARARAGQAGGPAGGRRPRPRRSTRASTRATSSSSRGSTATQAEATAALADRPCAGLPGRLPDPRHPLDAARCKSAWLRARRSEAGPQVPAFATKATLAPTL